MSHPRAAIAIGTLLLLVAACAFPAVAADPKVLATWGANGSGKGDFYRPWGIAVSPTGTVYVADEWNDRVMMFDTNGTPIHPLGLGGSRPGEFCRPRSIAISPAGTVFVADKGNRRVQVFDGNGSFIRMWYPPSSPGEQNYPSPDGIAAGPSGTVYVTDPGNDQVMMFQTNYDGVDVFVRKWGTHGTESGALWTPLGIAVGPSGTVYVADCTNSRIQLFNWNGVNPRTWGGPSDIGSNPGQFCFPVGIAVDAAGLVYVADTSNHRVQVLNANGVFIGMWGTQGSGPGQFSRPYGIAVDGAGNVYVVDWGNSRVQKFAPILLQVPGAAASPSDTNTDGRYEDVNGNGRKDFADVVLYFNQMSWIAANEPVPPFDYNGNGRIDFADVVWLFTAL